MPVFNFKVHGEKGEFLFLVHGWCCDHTFWRFQTARLASRFRVVTLDLEGHGLSAGTSEFSIDRFAENIVAVADALDVSKLALMGHSMGGPVAIEAGLRLAERCKFILGVDTFTDAAFYQRRPADEVALRVEKFAANFEATMAKMVRNITAPQTEPTVIADIIRVMTRCDRNVALTALRSLLEWDMEARWPLLDIPAATINSAMLRGGAELDLANLDLRFMHDVGHFPMLESPDAFNSIAMTILEEHGAG
ncbi:alpha/beta hydrolase [Rhizobium sp. BK602]|uniref:alpha/beta fold hydrolase n=1 Tax=Rhizobium sp. BK602 TaxID=2586986 RepID=UPI001610A249|nr:alpha/beta hydrolase [Rhizobium sp. BK602]